MKTEAETEFDFEDYEEESYELTCDCHGWEFYRDASGHIWRLN